MPVPFRRTAASLLAISVGVAVSLTAAASELPAIKTSPSKRAQMTGAGDLARPKGAAAAAPASASEDPLDRLRDRLSEKLGAKVSDDPRSDTVKVAITSPDGAAPPPVRRRTGAGAGHAAKGAGAAASGQPWSYDGPTGPDHWPSLRPEYGLCGKGSRQSPIDIRDGIGVDLDPIGFAYQPGTFSVVDTGRTVQVDVAPGNAIEVMGRRYLLERIEFRRPAEERINGRVFDFGAHLIHKDAEGRTAVVAVLFDRGAEQPVIQSVWNSLPLEKGETLASPHPLDVGALLPADRRYFTYMGSMTTPPCQEGVLWMVMKSPVALSSAQLAVFSRLYPMNARPVQPAAGRLIKGPQ